MQDGKPKRSWQQIAEEASREKDPHRLLELIQDLAAALDESAKQKESGATRAQKAS